MLEAIDLSKSYKNNLALDKLNLNIGKGEIFCLLGANGAGKTTTINLFLNFIDPTSGKVKVDGIDVNENPKETKRRLAYIPERVTLYPRLSGLENLAYFHELSGAKRLDRSEYLAILKRAGLPEEDAKRYLATYSKGMRQKVAIAIAIAKDAQALVLDEPTSGLDPAASNDFGSLLGQFSEEGKTVLMATHDIFRAKETGHRVGIMKHGALVEILESSQVSATDLEQIYLQHMRD